MSRKVLVADDEQACIDLVKDALADSGCEVIAACDGLRALELAHAHKPSVIILDVQMPGRNGFEVFAELRADEQLASIPVIMLTAVTARTGLSFSAKEMGSFIGSEPEAYLDKPIEPVVLQQVVGRLLRRSDTKA